jgi:hypothetical protein
MTPSKPPRTRTGAAEDPGLQALLALPPGERRDAVAKDIRRRAPQFSAILAHDLADALDVPEHWRPGSEWSFTRYAPIVSVEEHARYNSPASELVYLIEEAVTAERFQQLLKHSEPLDESDDPSFAFLTKGERSRLEDAIAEKQMEANESNGMNWLHHCSCSGSPAIGHGTSFPGPPTDGRARPLDDWRGLGQGSLGDSCGPHSTKAQQSS